MTLVTSHRPLATNLWPLAAEFSLVVLGMLLFSERTWKHHCVTLVLPCAVILYYLAVERPHLTLRWFLIGILAAVTLLMGSTSINGLSIWWDKGAKLAQVYGAYVWAYLLLILALVILLRRGEFHLGNIELRTSDMTSPLLVLRAVPEPAALREKILLAAEARRDAKGVREMDVSDRIVH